VHRMMTQATAVKMSNCKKLVIACHRESRRAVFRTRMTRDLPIRARRAMREMLVFWKRNEKEEREQRRKAEKAALEKLRQEEEEREARRQRRKLNFLITQTELYSHFIGGKVTAGRDDGDSNVATVAVAPQDAANEANMELDIVGHDAVDGSVDEMDFLNPSGMNAATDVQQPRMLNCELKKYQLKGLQWLANLYDQGINGILADEMGLGKTVQSISLMAHLAETHNLWGPFLVVGPAVTLHNWHQEVSRFVPDFKVLPYWGTVSERKVLRKSWSKLYTRDAPFHVLITSYQIVVADQSYFQKIKWQYMILDEAQAIKSSASTRWKTLLKFNTRNRLLLTGTPIQNNMQELWALLHFIMPTLFDSHDEFSDWFSKDIESHAENKGSLNEHQLRRLHMILKPFMLRRIKKNVQHELGDKIEIELSCTLSMRQRNMYRALREKISLAELLRKVEGNGDSDSSVDSLMNLVMQFRKVCNHPELFERAEATFPFASCYFGMAASLVREGDALNYGYSTRGVLSQNLPKHLYRHGGECAVVWRASSCATESKYLDHLMNIWRVPAELVCSDRSFAYKQEALMLDTTLMSAMRTISGTGAYEHRIEDLLIESEPHIVTDTTLMRGASPIHVPPLSRLVLDSGKLARLDKLLAELKAGGHRVLIYFQMTRMIDLMEEYLAYRRYTYLRLDGSSKIEDRRDMVTDWQTKDDIFIFLLSTRAGGLGINLTAADTVIFYDSDWNPTVDQQAMDRAHRLGQTRQVTVYRLITTGTIEERILNRAKQKDEIQKVVIAGGDFRPVELKSREIVSLLMEDE
ncbi:SNF2 family N-terminal domain-containing protein, partial [Thamnocephalis sphaerospora]